MDANQNCFLLDLLGEEGQRQLNWDANSKQTEVSTMAHAIF